MDWLSKEGIERDFLEKLTSKVPEFGTGFIVNVSQSCSAKVLSQVSVIQRHPEPRRCYEHFVGNVLTQALKYMQDKFRTQKQRHDALQQRRSLQRTPRNNNNNNNNNNSNNIIIIVH